MSLRAAALGGSGTGVSGAPFPGYVSGNWYAPYLSAVPTNGGGGANVSLVLALHYFPQAVTITALGIKVTTASAGNAMVGLYAHNATTGQPTGPALASITGLSTASTGVVSAALGAPVAFPAGFYWAASELDNATAALQTFQNGALTRSTTSGSPTMANVALTNMLGFAVTNTYGSFPDLTAASFNDSANLLAAAVYFRAQ